MSYNRRPESLAPDASIEITNWGARGLKDRGNGEIAHMVECEKRPMSFSNIMELIMSGPPSPFGRPQP